MSEDWLKRKVLENIKRNPPPPGWPNGPQYPVGLHEANQQNPSTPKRIRDGQQLILSHVRPGDRLCDVAKRAGIKTKTLNGWRSRPDSQEWRKILDEMRRED